MFFIKIRHFKRYTVFPSLSFCHCLDTETLLRLRVGDSVWYDICTRKEKKELGAVLGIVFCGWGVCLLEDILLPCLSGD